MAHTRANEPALLRERSVISKHIKNIFEEGELEEKSNVQILHIAHSDKPVRYYNLDVIISVGYRVKSQQGTQFRQWATKQLREYIVKGFVLNDDRFKEGSSYNYFRELLERIREIRLSERLFYQQIKDIYATSIDYNKDDELTLSFFKEVQNKLLWAVSGKTAAELLCYRANAELPLMGLQTTKRTGKVTQADALIAKNYLNETELQQLKLIVEQFLAFAETQALMQRPMYMKDWAERLGLILTMNKMNILEHKGKVSHALAEQHAKGEYKKYKELEHKQERIESLRELEQDLKRLEIKRKKKDNNKDE